MLIKENILRSFIRSIIKEVSDKNKIEQYMAYGKKELSRYYSGEDFKRRIMSAINKGSKKITEKEVDEYISDVNTKLDQAVYKIVAKPTDKSDPHYNDYRSNAYLHFPAERGDYEKRMKAIPTIILPTPVINHANMSDQLLNDLVVHELSHVETELRIDLERKYAAGAKTATGLAFKNIIIDENELLQVYDKKRWEGTDKMANYIGLLRSQLMTSAYMADQELAARLGQLRKSSKGEVEEAIKFSRENTFEVTREKYGEFPTQLLFAFRIDISEKEIANVLDGIAKSDNLNSDSIVV